MFLSFETDFGLLDEAARSAARIYCARSHYRAEYDDAYQDALLAAVETSVDPKFPPLLTLSYLIERVLGKLIRSWQQANGKRLKNPLKRAETSDAHLANVPQRESRDVSLDVARANAIERAKSALKTRDRLIVEEWLKHSKQREIARLFGLSPSRVCAIIRKFKEIARNGYKNKFEPIGAGERRRDRRFAERSGRNDDEGGGALFADFSGNAPQSR